jgi:hypothetical protein
MQLDSTQQTRRSYANFCGKIDALTDHDVIWTSYIDVVIVSHAP